MAQRLRVQLKYTDPNPGDIRYHEHEIGNARQRQDGRWMKVEKTAYVIDGHFGNAYGYGRIVPAETALRIHEEWKLKDNVRLAECYLRTALRSDDADQDFIDRRKQQLADARKAAGIE